MLKTLYRQAGREGGSQAYTLISQEAREGGRDGWIT